VVVTGLLLSSLLSVQAMTVLAAVSPGFVTDRLFVSEIGLFDTKYRDAARNVAFQNALLEEIRAAPGVSKATMTSHFPFAGMDRVVAMQVHSAPAAPLMTSKRLVDSQYFDTLRIPVRAGRSFDDSDLTSRAPVVVVSESLAQSLFGTNQVLGRQLPSSPPREIVGVVGDVLHDRLDLRPRPTWYIPRTHENNSVWV
jgi:putative ABC transport system permease protein